MTTKRTFYQYDAFDRRVLDRYDAPGGLSLDRYDYTVYDGDDAIAALRDSDGIGTAQGYRISNRYLHGNMIDQVFADEQYTSGIGPVFSATTPSTLAGTTLWTLGDHLGSVRDVVDNTGITRQHVVYDSFGRRLSEVERNAAGNVIASTDATAIDTIFSYTGREWDQETNLQNNRARWYDPATGRWISQDPIGFEAGDANLYRYVGNGPTSRTDPSGLEQAIRPVFPPLPDSGTDGVFPHLEVALERGQRDY